MGDKLILSCHGRLNAEFEGEQFLAHMEQLFERSVRRFPNDAWVLSGPAGVIRQHQPEAR